MNSFAKLFLLDFFVASAFGATFGDLNGEIIKLYAQRSIKQFEMTSGVLSLLTVSAILGMTIGSMTTSFLMKKFSKQALTVLSAGFAILCNLLCMFCVHWVYLFIFRLLNGFFQSIIATIIPGWLVELAQDKQRSILTGTYQINITVGLSINSIMMLIIKHNKYLLQLTFLYAIIANVGIIFITMMIKDKVAKFTQKQINVFDNSTNHLTLFSPELRKSVLNAFLLAFGSQFTGINSIVLYAAKAFENMFDSQYSSIYGNLIINLVNTSACLLPLPFLNRVGRKKLLLSGWFIVNLGHLILILAYSAFKNNSGQNICILLGSIVFLIGFEIGPGPVLYMVYGEVFPRQFAPQLQSIAFTGMWVGNVIVILTFPFFNSCVWLVYCLYFVFSLAPALILLKTMPETFNRSFEQIELEVMRVSAKKKEICIQSKMQNFTDDPQSEKQDGENSDKLY